MNEFINKLTQLRQGATNVAKGTLANMKRGIDGTAAREMEEARRARDEELMRENFGSVEAYEKMMSDMTPEEKELFTPTYVKVGRGLGKAGRAVKRGAESLMDRLVQMRGGGN